MGQGVVDNSPSADAPPAGPDDDEPPPRHRYWQQVHVEFVVAMVAVVAVLSVLGVIWLPQSGAYPAVPEDLTVNVYGSNVNYPVVEVLEQTQGGSTVLEVAEDYPEFTVPNPREHWAVTVDHLTTFGAQRAGRVCQPQGDLDPGTRLQTPSPPTTRVTKSEITVTLGRPDILSLEGAGFRAFTTVIGRGMLLVSLCWSSGGPDRLDGSYLSAFLPPAVSGGLLDQADSQAGPAIKNISRFVLVPDGGDAADYNVQASSAPLTSSVLGEAAWEWPPSTILSPIRVTASNAITSQHEVYLSFLSGIAFGIAGGAAIAIMQELLDPLSRRRDRKHGAGEEGEH
jgi:hypothetical protein